MATLHIRNVPDGVVEALKVRAAGRGRSLNAEVVDVLTASAPQRRSVEEVLESIRELAHQINDPRTGQEVADEIRADREARADRIWRLANRLPVDE